MKWNTRQGFVGKRPSLLMALEPRILYDGAGADVAAEVGAASLVPQDSGAPAAGQDAALDSAASGDADASVPADSAAPADDAVAGEEAAPAVSGQEETTGGSAGALAGTGQDGGNAAQGSGSSGTGADTTATVSETSSADTGTGSGSDTNATLTTFSADSADESTEESGTAPLDADLGEQPISQVVFVDTTVQDHQRLLDGVIEASDNDDTDVNPTGTVGTSRYTVSGSTLVVTLGENPLDDIGATLSICRDLDAVHIISHGGEGALRLGDTVIDGSSIERYQAFFGRLGESLSEEGDLLLYGCRVGRDGQGQAFVDRLAAFSGADVNASDDDTGNASSGGDWDLEVATGPIEATPLLNEQNVGGWAGVLNLSLGLPTEMDIYEDLITKLTGITVTDSNPATQITLRLSFPEHHGILSVAGAVGHGVHVADGGGYTLVLTGTVQDIQNLLSDSNSGIGVFYKSPHNGNHDYNGAAAGDVTLTVTVEKENNPPVSGQMAITIVATNDKPTMTTDSVLDTPAITGPIKIGPLTAHDLDITLPAGDSIADGEENFMQVTVRLMSAQSIVLSRTLHESVQFTSPNGPAQGPDFKIDDYYHGVGRPLVIRGTLSNINAYLSDLHVEFTGDALKDSNKIYEVQVIGDDRLRNLDTGRLITNASGDGIANGGQLNFNENTGQLETVPTYDPTPYQSFGGLTQNIIRLSIHVLGSSENDAPEVSGLSGRHYTENSPAVVIGGGITLKDPELGADRPGGKVGDWSGATLTVQRAGGADAEDVFVASGGLSALTQGATLMDGSKRIGTVTEHGNGTLTITFAKGVTTTDAQAAMAKIAYQNARESLAQGATDTVWLEWTLNDQNSNGGGGSGQDQGTGGPLSGSQVQEITLHGINDDPVAEPDHYTMNEGGAPITLDPLANDTDVDGDSLTITHIAGVPLTPGTAQDIPVPNGTVHVNAAGVITFTPAAGFTGTVVFPYTISDGNGGSDTANQSITVNGVPVAVDDSTSTPEDTPVTIDVLVNDSDSDGDPLSVTGASVDPSQGTVTVNPDGTLTFVPAPNFHGTALIAYTITDDNGGTATATVRVDVIAVNDAPGAVDDSGRTGRDRPVTIDVLANDSDPDGDPLSVIGASVDPSQGTVAVNPDGTLRFVPAHGFTGTALITYTISDGRGGTATATVSVLVQAPRSHGPHRPEPLSPDAPSSPDGPFSPVVPAPRPPFGSTGLHLLTSTMTGQGRPSVPDIGADRAGSLASRMPVVEDTPRMLGVDTALDYDSNWDLLVGTDISQYIHDTVNHTWERVERWYGTGTPGTELLRYESLGGAQDPFNGFSSPMESRMLEDLGTLLDSILEDGALGGGLSGISPVMAESRTLQNQLSRADVMGREVDRLSRIMDGGY